MLTLLVYFLALLYSYLTSHPNSFIKYYNTAILLLDLLTIVTSLAPAFLLSPHIMSSENALALRPAPQRSDDDWSAVEDKKLRKKIQDRLAQRARRRRIAESKQKQKEQSPTPEHGAPFEVEMELIAAVAPADLFSTAEYHLLPRRFMSALQALYNNGVVLGMSVLQSCGTAISHINPSAPKSLQPTNLQLSVIHYTAVDRFPFPVFRDNLILMQDNIDPQEFMYDIINMHSFWVIDGKAPWDQSAWRMSKDYEQKWGYLFFGESKSTTNFSVAPSLSYSMATTAC